MVNGHISARAGILADNLPLGKAVRYSGR